MPGICYMRKNLMHTSNLLFCCQQFFSGFISGGTFGKCDQLDYIFTNNLPIGAVFLYPRDEVSFKKKCESKLARCRAQPRATISTVFFVNIFFFERSLSGKP